MHAFDEDVTAERTRLQYGDVKLGLHRVVRLPGKERHLPVVVWPVAKESVSFQPVPRATTYLRNVNCRVLSRGLAMPAEKIMPRRNENMADGDDGLHASREPTTFRRFRQTVARPF